MQDPVHELAWRHQDPRGGVLLSRRIKRDSHRCREGSWVQGIQSVQDLVHRLAWSLDACLKDRVLDEKRMRELHQFFGPLDRPPVCEPSLCPFKQISCTAVGLITFRHSQKSMCRAVAARVAIREKSLETPLLAGCSTSVCGSQQWLIWAESDTDRVQVILQ